MKVESLKHVADIVRGRGNSDYIIRAVIENPNVTVICPTESNKKEMYSRYYNALRERRYIFKRMKRWFIKNPIEPIFLSAGDHRAIAANKSRPVIMDVSVMHLSAS